MAAMPEILRTVDQPRPKLVPRPNSTHAVFLHTAPEKIKVQIRPSERRPRHILLGTVNHCDFRVTKAIPLHVDVRGDQVIASWHEVEEFGTGASMSLACDDLGHTLVELYSTLEKDESRLGPDLARVWSVLKAYIVRR